MIATKRGIQRKNLIKRIEGLEYVVSQLMTNSYNLELLFDYYVEMNGDVKKFEEYLDKKTKDAESSQFKSK